MLDHAVSRISHEPHPPAPPAHLGLAARTVEDHIHEMFKKARVGSRAELVAKVLRADFAE